MSKVIQMYSIFDKKSDRFDTPFFTFDEIGAKRHFIMMCRKKGTMISTFKNEFQLVHIGSFDVNDGMMEVLNNQKVVLTGLEVLIDDKVGENNQESN